MRPLGIAGIAIIALATAGCGAAPSASNDPSAPPASIRLVAARSWCLPDPMSATIKYVVSLRNTGGSDGQTSVSPWRRYDDASINNGLADGGTVDVPAGKTVRAALSAPWDVAQHDLLTCGVLLGSDPNGVPRRIRIIR